MGLNITVSKIKTHKNAKRVTYGDNGEILEQDNVIHTQVISSNKELGWDHVRYVGDEYFYYKLLMRSPYIYRSECVSYFRIDDDYYDLFIKSVKKYLNQVCGSSSALAER